MIKINDSCYHYRDHLRKEVKNVKRFGNAVTLSDFLMRANSRYLPQYENEREENTISFFFIFMFMKKLSKQNKDEKHIQYSSEYLSQRIEQAFQDAMKEANKSFFSKKQTSIF